MIFPYLLCRFRRIGFLSLVASMAAVCTSQAQIAEHIFSTDPRIDPEKKGELRIEIDNLDFFRDNEYTGSVMAGYSLPGFWLQPKAVYYPTKRIKLEAGVHMLAYWGADRYPNMAYIDIARWRRKGYQAGVHILPFLRAQIALSDYVDIVFGDLYGGSSHRLVEPLYSPELNLTADPEAGLQVLYHSAPVDLDVWVNWQSFIFREDVHQEAFTVGLSTRWKLNDPSQPFHFYIPLQVLVQHRGGEIDTIYTHSVQTLMNGAVGAGMAWNTGHRLFRRVELEADALGYYQQAGRLWPFDKGAAFYIRGALDIAGFRVKTAYFLAHRFISMYGLPFYGAVSTQTSGLTYRNPQTFYIGAEYTWQLGRGYALGVDVDVYQRLRATANHPRRGVYTDAGATSFAAGVYLRLNPSFLIKRFSE